MVEICVRRSGVEAGRLFYNGYSAGTVCCDYGGFAEEGIKFPGILKADSGM